MGQRKLDPRIKELYEQKKKVYSYSKCNTINQCEYQAWKLYIQKPKEQQLQNCYSVLGSRIHDVLENIINDKAAESDLLPAMQQEFKDVEMLGLDFPKTSKGEYTIKAGWEADMTHFCNNFVRPKGKFETEKLMLIDLGNDRWLQGYIDLIKIVDEEKKIIDIIDWKTSSKFSKEDLLHHGRQLVLYALSQENEGYTVKNIGWYMLKYARVDFLGYQRVNSKTRTELSIICNRGKIVKELEKHIKRELEDLGYDELDIEILLMNAKENNSLDELPEAVKNNYKVKPHIEKYEYSNELKDEAIKYINECADLFEKKVEIAEEEWTPKSFTKKTKTGKEVEDTFFCTQLCGFRKSCEHIKQYYEMKEFLNTSDEELF